MQALQHHSPTAPAVCAQLETFEAKTAQICAAIEPLEIKAQELFEAVVNGDTAQAPKAQQVGETLALIRRALEEARRRETVKRAEHDAALLEDTTESQWDNLAELALQIEAMEPQNFTFYNWETKTGGLTERGQLRLDFIRRAVELGLLSSFDFDFDAKTRPGRIAVSDLLFATQNNLGQMENRVSTTPNSRPRLWAEIEARRAAFCESFTARGVNVSALITRAYGDDSEALDALDTARRAG